ncbi:hypothetical protein NXU87_03255 [Candidatus Bacteroides intestinigallinarum]|jgi:hypothetical protein|uniref:hypothetical protein n=1 Tax=Bacteroides TaxID=816 RepID=UPI000E7DFCD3|nr:MULTISPECIES: hypothetical protein [Bacteroides]MCS3175123.1 hypothetical protein [Candidatus Bacteroides intestinigallinarum]RGN53955.1 hypothetical protein DXB58_25050 [Bacteroides sp. OM05-10AA]RGQ58386.1 hypothetical protein DWY87_24350 [Bacteroides sp. AF27-33]DAS85388.1 MAG TPA: holin [Caudoviricetes sp.]
MSLNEWLAVLGAVGGTSTITWFVTFWVNRKTNARKEDASADGMEIQNLLSIITAQSAQIDNQEKRMGVRDTKVDFLYSENNKLRSDQLELIREKHELELRLKEAELKKCDVRGCIKRQPPSDY